MWGADRNRRRELEARIAAARKRADDEQAKIDYSDDEEGQGPGASEYDGHEHYFLAATYHDRASLFWLKHAGLLNRARRLGIAIPTVFDGHDLELDEALFSAFSLEVNKQGWAEIKRRVEVVGPILSLVLALAAVFVTYNGNRRYNALEALTNERSDRLQSDLKAARESADALRIRTEELSRQLAKLSANQSPNVPAAAPTPARAKRKQR